MKHKIFYTVLLVFALQAWQRVNAQFANLTFDKAYGLGKGHFELAPVFTNYYFNDDWVKGVQLAAAGIRFGVGVTDNFDLKVRYERLFSYNANGGGLNVIALEPKISFAGNKLAIRVPAQITFRSDNGYNYSSYIAVPQLLYTSVNAKRTFDFTGAIRSDISFEEYGNGKNMKAFAGFTIGSGFSNNLDKWAIRPEVSLFSDWKFEGHWWQFGVAGTFRFGGKDKPAHTKAPE